MSSFNRELIQYNGIHTCINNNIINFRQQNIDHLFCIPCNKHKIDQIFKVWVESYIVDFEIVKTSKGLSLECQQMTGYNVLVSGDINLKFEYIAKDMQSSVHIVRSVFPFCAFLTLPENFKLSSRVYPIIYIEDIFTKKVNSHCIYTNITFVLAADVCKEVKKEWDLK